MASIVISAEKLGLHASENDGWMAINGEVWDVSGFASEHPGGGDVIKECLGRDASEVYNSVHGPAMISQHFGVDKRIGLAEENTNARDQAESELPSTKPPLELILSMNDFEEAACQTLSEGTWAYCSGATNDGFTKEENSRSYRQILLRPRILKDVSQCDTSVRIFGTKFPFPFFNAPASLAKMVHPQGELALAQGAAAMGSTVMVSCMSSFTLEEIVATLPSGYPFFFQLYVHSDRATTERMVRQAVSLKPTAILVTVDLPTFSKREAKERYDARQLQSKNGRESTVTPSQARAPARSISAALEWTDLRWLKGLVKLPIVLKGIQCAADAKMAFDHGCDGIYISNHGGRALDTCSPSILTLMEIQAECPEVLKKMEVFLDGGVRRGTDMLKAVCLGASAVCLGRPFLYAAAYGQEGVQHAIRILDEELRSAMALCGITSLDQAHPGLLNTKALDPLVCQGVEHPWAKKIIRGKL